jgi:peptide deformylase
MTKFAETTVAQKKYDITLSEPSFVEGAECDEMTVEDITEEHLELTKKMLRFLSDVKGLGLAAPQIGIKKKFFAYWDESLNPHVVYNPKYYAAEKKQETWVEKCLTYGDLKFVIKRFKYLSAVWWEFDPEKKELYKVTKRLRGLNAQVFQHETDHVNGETIATKGIPFPTN